MFVWDHVLRDIGSTIIPCNWLQIMENSLDPVHVEWLHGRFADYVLERLGRPELKRKFYRPGGGASNGVGDRWAHEKIGFDEFPYGIIKRRVVAGRTEQDPEWRIGHPVLFPNILRGQQFPVGCRSMIPRPCMSGLRPIPSPGSGSASTGHHPLLHRAAAHG